MCACSRSLSTGWPATATSNTGGPTTRSCRMEFVAVLRSAAAKPVHAAASARSCSNPTHAGERNGRIATAMMTIAVATPIRRPARRTRAVRTVSSYPARPGNRLTRARRPRRDETRSTRGLLVLERPGLVPPTLHPEIGRRFHVELARALVDPCPEFVKVEIKDVAQTL